ncbi:TetR/AcrR family transcriptional regulator C-terminal domain-containing protein [Streptomyces sp. NPDC093224]|uniref:TetR/AcrR family transcriptional regulator C-terminal domain-containing protein n=1 Tax=Streptomyces sp. NPDC093224 TaxID=3155198 RepID=UPI003440819D
MNEPEATERSLDLLWAAAVERSPRGSRPKLSVERIVGTAIDIADAEGIEALSMQRVASEFGYTTMSLYRYVPGKTQLVDVMADVACGLPPDMSEVTGGWRAEVERWVDALWEVYRRHDWLVRIHIKNPPIGPNQLAWFETLLRSLSRTGLGYEDMAALAMFVSSAVRDLARFSTDLVPMGLGYAKVLENIVETDRFPTVATLLASGGASAGAESGESAVRPVVRFGVARLLDGIEAQVGLAGGSRPESAP